MIMLGTDRKSIKWAQIFYEVNRMFLKCISTQSLLLLVAITIVFNAPLQAAKEQRAILFGVSYLPQVTCVEDFSPYWITDNWTEKRTVNDLKIMKAIGCSVVRFHIAPAKPEEYKTPGVAPEKVLPMLDLAVNTANDLGLRVHLDIASGVTEYGEEGVKLYLNRYRGKVESYQIGNEQYNWPRDPERMKWLQGLVELGHSIDPHAKLSADMLVPDWVKIRKEMPDLYRQLDMGLAHYYPLGDYRGWNDVYIADLVDHLSNPTGRKRVMESFAELLKKNPGAYDQYEANVIYYDHPLYAGSWAWLDKEVWITEISTYGYWRWGNLTPENKRAADWEKVVNAINGADNRVTRMYHHCFRDKMSWREYGMGQAGIVYYDGAPRPVTFTFKKMAVKYAPSDSPLRALDCEIERVVVPEDAKTVELKVKLTNTTKDLLKGHTIIEPPDKSLAKETAFDFALRPKESKTWNITIEVGDMKWGSNHAFARIKIPQGLVYGWGIIAKSKRLEIDTAPTLNPELSSKVRYAQGYEAVQEFLDKYSDKCAIVIGPGTGTDAELGYRLKTVLQAMRCREVPLRHSAVATDVLNRPIIVIGSPEYNLVSRTVETALPEDQRVTKTNPGEGKGVITVIQEPLGKMAIGGRDSKQAQQIGYFFGGVPAALYIAGPDDGGTKAAVYDLILRTWGSEGKYK